MSPEFRRFLELQGIEMAEYVKRNVASLKAAAFRQDFVLHQGALDGPHVEYAIIVLAEYGDDSSAHLIAQYFRHPELYVRVRVTAELTAFPALSDQVYELAIEATLKEQSRLGGSMYFSLLKRAGRDRIERLVADDMARMEAKFGKDVLETIMKSE
jgi:hypothetical protein